MAAARQKEMNERKTVVATTTCAGAGAATPAPRAPGRRSCAAAEAPPLFRAGQPIPWNRAIVSQASAAVSA